MSIIKSKFQLFFCPVGNKFASHTYKSYVSIFSLKSRPSVSSRYPQISRLPLRSRRAVNLDALFALFALKPVDSGDAVESGRPQESRFARLALVAAERRVALVSLESGDSRLSA